MDHALPAPLIFQARDGGTLTVWLCYHTVYTRNSGGRWRFGNRDGHYWNNPEKIRAAYERAGWRELTMEELQDAIG